VSGIFYSSRSIVGPCGFLLVSKTGKTVSVSPKKKNGQGEKKKLRGGFLSGFSKLFEFQINPVSQVIYILVFLLNTNLVKTSY